MASSKHQFILGLIIKNMRSYGCDIRFVDGQYKGPLNDGIKLPPNILSHRPDVLGITEFGQVCIGEAKTESDLRSLRTKEQIVDFVSIELNGMPCEVFLGIPYSGKERLNRLLKDLGLNKHPNIHVLYVPEEIINEKT